MKRHFSAPLFSILLFLSVVVPAAPDIAWAQADDEDYAPADTVFVEISLGPDGIRAIDSAGYDWYYDFDRDQFVVGFLPLDLGDEDDLEDVPQIDIQPVEERCVNEKKVKPWVHSVLVASDEYVDGSIVAVDRVTVKGWVKGDVTSMNKRVLVTATGRVDGYIQAPEIIVKPGGIVLGDQLLTSWEPETPSGIGLLIVIVFLAVFLFFGFLAVTLMPKQVANFSRCISENQLKTYSVGLFFIVLMPIIVLLLVVTIVGTVLVVLLPLVYLFAIILGTMALGDRIGGFVASRLLGGERSLIFRSLTGTFLVFVLWIITAVLFGIGDPVANGFGILFLVIAIIVSSYPLFTGVGAAVLTRFGFKPYVSWKERQQEAGRRPAPAPAPPPIPSAPPEPSPRSYPSDTDETTTS